MPTTVEIVLTDLYLSTGVIYLTIFDPQVYSVLVGHFENFGEEDFLFFEITMLARVSCLLPKGMFYIADNYFRNSISCFLSAGNVTDCNLCNYKYTFL